MLEHSLGILDDAEDAEVRSHLQTCDACRADGAELLVISERLRELGAATEAPGRETFADRTRYDVRGAFGETRGQRATASWRVTSGITESQRIRRIAVQKRNSLVRLIGTIGAVVGVPVVLLSIAYLTGAVAFAVDHYGAGVENTLGINLASLGLRPAYEAVTDKARSAQQTKDLGGLDDAVARLVRRELSMEACRAESVVVLEFAHALVKSNNPDAASVIAAALERASGVAEPETPAKLDALAVVRAARGYIQSGVPGRAQQQLELLVVSGMDLALYYSAVAKSGSAEGDDAYVKAAAVVPAVWLEIAWRRAAKKDVRGVRAALSKAPSGALRDATTSLLAKSK